MIWRLRKEAEINMNKKNTPEVVKEETAIATKETRHPLQIMVDQATEERKILSTYIATHMVKGVDYAPIHINKTCPNKYNCTVKYHFSKDNLTKAGAEKIKDLLKLYPDFKKDSDTWEMAGSKPGLFCYRCILLTQDGKPAGVGLGACDASEKMGNMNNAIKIAKKRAFVDAILTTGSLSDFFTQDLEDMHLTDDKEPVRVGSNVSTVPVAVSDEITKVYNETTEKEDVPVIEAKLPVHMITPLQKTKIMTLLPLKGKTLTDLEGAVAVFEVESYQDLTLHQANKVIEKLESLPDQAKRTAPEDTIDPDEADKGIEQMRLKN
jgi:hypothetical protein